jgi:hypothetical protein
MVAASAKLSPIELSFWVHLFILCKNFGFSISLHLGATAWLSWIMNFLINFLHFVMFQDFWAL